MPMRKLPAAVLEAKGAFAINPERRRIDPVTTGDLGTAPAYFTPEETAIWDELKQQIPVGLAKSADRFLAEITVKLMTKFRYVGCNASETSQLMNALGRLGCTPADRLKCAIAPEPKKDENQFQEFI